jgi:Flp pilus assembly protein TadD
MVVDPRLDHSIRIPRPDLTQRLGTPNACDKCHADKTAKWAADAIATWKPDYRPRPHYGEALHAGRAGHPNSGVILSSLANDKTQPGIARATALALLRDYIDAATLPVIAAAAKDPDPLVRGGALESLESVPHADRLEAARHLVNDPVRAVRVAAARTLAGVPKEQWSDTLRPAFEGALAEYEAFQRLNGDQPWAHVNLGIVQLQQSRFEDAEASYRRAIALDKNWMHAYINLADLYRARDQDDKCENVLREGLMELPGSAELSHSLGMAQHRRKNPKGALTSLARAALLRPDVPRYSYAYGVALHSTGKFDMAIRVLVAAHERAPRDFDILEALASYHLGANQLEPARHWGSKLYKLAPQNQQVQALMQALSRRR